MFRIVFVLGVSFTASTTNSPGVCDIFAAGGTPCVAAHALTRALFAAYDGPLYRVFNSQRNESIDIGVVSAGGIANVAPLNQFCASSLCIVSRIYDQTSRLNHLAIEVGPSFFGPPRNSRDTGVNISVEARVSVGGQEVYAAVFDSHCDHWTNGHSCDGKFAGYSNRSATAPTGDAPQTVYALYDGKHFSTGCCMEYGNAENLQNKSTFGPGAMEAVYYGCNDTHPPLPACTEGPYVYSDLEHMHEMMTIPGFEPVRLAEVDFLLAMVKGQRGRLATLAADASKDVAMRSLYDGPFPANYTSNKQGAIVLGIGGDNSPWGDGTFYEGALTAGFSTDLTDSLVLANIVSARYAKVN